MFPSLSAFPAIKHYTGHRNFGTDYTHHRAIFHSPQSFGVTCHKAFDAPNQRMRKVASDGQFARRLLPLEVIMDYIEKQFGQQCQAAIDASNVTSSEL